MVFCKLIYFIQLWVKTFPDLFATFKSLAAEQIKNGIKEN